MHESTSQRIQIEKLKEEGRKQIEEFEQVKEDLRKEISQNVNTIEELKTEHRKQIEQIEQLKTEQIEELEQEHRNQIEQLKKEHLKQIEQDKEEQNSVSSFSNENGQKPDFQMIFGENDLVEDPDWMNDGGLALIGGTPSTPPTPPPPPNNDDGKRRLQAIFTMIQNIFANTYKHARIVHEFLHYKNKMGDYLVLQLNVAKSTTLDEGHSAQIANLQSSIDSLSQTDQWMANVSTQLNHETAQMKALFSTNTSQF